MWTPDVLEILSYVWCSLVLSGSSSDMNDKDRGLPLLLHQALSCCSAVAPSHSCQHLAFVGLSLVAPVKPRTYCTPIQQKASIKWKPCKLVFIWLLLHLMNMFSFLSLSLTWISCWIFPFSVDFFFFYTPASNGFVTLASFFISTNANLVCFRHYTLYISRLTGQGLIYQCDISNM